MGFVRTGKQYLIGVPSIDEEHRLLFEEIVDIARKMLFLKCRPHLDVLLTDKVTEVLQKLKTHYEREEDWMKEVGFPEFTEHQKEHENDLIEMEKETARLRENDEALCVGIFAEIINRMDEHVLQHDKKLGEFYQNQVVNGYRGGGQLKTVSHESDQATGVTHLDDEHDILFRLISRILHELSKKSIENVQFTEALLSDLQEEMQHHFRHEERLMELYEIDTMQEHCLEHQRFTGALEDLIFIVQNNTSETLQETTNNALSIISAFSSLIHTHVMEYDQKIAVQIQRKAAQEI